MIALLIKNPLLLLFVVAAIGYPLGRINIRGSSLGVAAVLFVGLAIGSLHPDLKLPEIIYVLGLMLFVYTIGLSSGPEFFASFRREGVKYNILCAAVIAGVCGLTLVLARLAGFSAPVAAGIFAGALTNTPALAGALETLKGMAPPGAVEQLLAEPVVGYSVSYPVGVIGVLLAIGLCQRLWRVDYAEEARSLRKYGATNDPIHNLTIRVTRSEAAETVASLRERFHGDVIFGRVKHTEKITIAGDDTRLEVGDLVVAVGNEGDLEQVAAWLGERSEEQLELDRSEFYFRRIFVSSHDVAGRTLDDLDLGRRFGAIATRLRRGDSDFLPHGDTVLELGDRVRVVAHRDRMKDVSEYFGDSYRGVSEIDILTFSLGIALGLLLGLIPFPLPGGLTFKLGFAGGPLIAGLVLGTLGRTGKMVWSLPYSANLTLRQIGLILFLAGIGTRAGYSFVSTFTKGGGLTIFAAGAVLTCVAAMTMLWVGYRVFKIPMSLLVGMVAGTQTQPAVLGFALEQTKNDVPNIGYAAVYPVATLSKIIFVQLLLAMLPMKP